MKSKAVLITGCSSGIGRATAIRLADAGWPVYATARRVEAIDDLKQYGCAVLALDVTDDASMQAAVERVEADAGAVGVLVNNAGFSQSGALETVPVDDGRRQFETNVFGLVRLTQLALPAMRAQGWGRVVNVSSMGGRLTFPGGGWYHASKHALEAISDAWRFELAGFGIAVIVIQPGLIKTGFADAAVASLDSSTDAEPYSGFTAAVAKATTDVYDGPLSRLGGGPDTVAETIQRAIEDATPRARYRVTPSARLLLGMRRLLPDRAWDAVVARSFPRPGAA